MAARSADSYEEGIDGYERMHVDSIALGLVFDVVERLRKDKGFMGPECARFDRICPLYNVQFVYNPLQANLDEHALKQAVETRDGLKPTADALHKIWRLISHQMKTCEGYIEAYKNRKGFFSLPDEILSTVLEYAALQGDSEESVVRSVRSATNLSHVCKRFRDLIMHSPSLWKRVNNGMDCPEMVSTCLAHCRRTNAELEVTLNTRFYGTLFHQNNRKRRYISPFTFTSAILKESSNWGSFFHIGDVEYTLKYQESEHGLQDYSELSRETEFPNLKQLTIHYPKTALAPKVCDKIYHNLMHFYSAWSAPKLRSMFVENFVPVPFPGAQSLTSLKMFLDFNRHREDLELDVRSFASFLTACPLLEKFSLVIFAIGYVAIKPLSGCIVDMPCVSSLDLTFIYCCGGPVKSFFNAVRFPKATAIRLMIGSSGDHEDMLFDDVFFAVLPDAEAFPNLTDMTLEVNADGFRNKTNGQFVHGGLSIPFATMPKLRHLKLQANSHVAPIPDAIALPSLRTFVITNSSSIGRTWLGQFLKQMKAQGDLDLLRLSVDDRCHTLNRSGVEGLLSREDMLQLIAPSD